MAHADARRTEIRSSAPGLRPPAATRLTDVTTVPSFMKNCSTILRGAASITSAATSLAVTSGRRPYAAVVGVRSFGAVEHRRGNECERVPLRRITGKSLGALTAGMIETTGLDEDTVVAWMTAVWRPDSVKARASVLGGAMDPTSGYTNTRAWRASEFPCCNMFADARSLARMYAATVSEVDGVRLLDPETVEKMIVVQTGKSG